MALDMNGIKNENEFFTTHYIAAMLEGDLEPLVRSWKEEAETTAQPTPARRLQEWGRRRLKRDRSGAATEENLLPELLEILGYEPARAMLPLGDGSLRAEAEVQILGKKGRKLARKGDRTASNIGFSTQCRRSGLNRWIRPYHLGAGGGDGRRRPARGGSAEQPHICGGGAAAFRPAVLLPAMRAGRPVQMECPPPAALLF